MRGREQEVWIGVRVAGPGTNLADPIGGGKIVGVNGISRCARGNIKCCGKNVCKNNTNSF